jgi:hypothetical protein
VRELKGLLACKNETALTQNLVLVLGKVEMSLNESCFVSRSEVVNNATGLIGLWEEIPNFYKFKLDGGKVGMMFRGAYHIYPCEGKV